MIAAIAKQTITTATQANPPHGGTIRLLKTNSCHVQKTLHAAYNTVSLNPLFSG